MSTAGPLLAQTGQAPAAPAILAPWTGPYGGVPPFDRVKAADFGPAYEAGVAEQRREIAAIANQRSMPTFENTLVRYEDSGRALDRFDAVYGVYTSTLNSADVQAIERDLAPKQSGFRDEITQNRPLYDRIKAVYEARAGLTPEQQRLAWVRWNGFKRSGAELDAAQKTRLTEINRSLAGLFTRFGQNTLADEEGYTVALTGEADFAGLPESVAGAARAAAAERKATGGLITNTRSSVDPFLTYSEVRPLREKAWRMFVGRGDNGDARDNNAIVAEILQLRAERAKLLGYPTHAHWRLENAMAKTPERAMELMLAVWTPAKARVREEVADMQAIVDREGGGFKIAPWDYRFYAEKVRKAKYDLDQNEVKPYLQLDKLREGMFFVAGELFGFTFAPIADAPVYHPDVKVWAVKGADGRHVGLWYFDPYARAGKQSGAWMNAYRNQERFEQPVTTIVSNNANFTKPAPGEPVLVSWNDAETLFHEFGHALHGLSSNVTYPTLSGTSVARDYVEFPSQLLEHWLSTPQVLNRYALHYQTGRPIPAELVQKIERASKFNQGFDTVEYLASALVDMRFHLAGDRKLDPKVFERETLTELGMPSEIVMRHRTPHFGHAFGSDGYSAGYYSYLWADTLTAEAWEAFVEAGGAYDKAVAKRLRDTVFSVGNTVDPADGFRAFRGREPTIQPLLRDRGFA